MIKSVLFIGGVADGKWIAMESKPEYYNIPIPPKTLPMCEEGDINVYYDAYYRHLWFDNMLTYIEEHLGPDDAFERLAHYYRPGNQDAD